jgi:rod shape-determining protein MreB and related proteins
MIVDIGGGTTDIAVISMAGTVNGRSLRVAGDAMNDAITTYMKRACNLLIGERTAEQIKMELGSAAPLDEPLKMEVKGRHAFEGVPRTVEIWDAEVREALAEPLRQIVQAVRDSLERIPPELSADIYDRGMILTGGGAMLRNLDQRLAAETGLPVLVAEHPLTSVVMGAGMILSDLPLMRKVVWASRDRGQTGVRPGSDRGQTGVRPGSDQGLRPWSGGYRSVSVTAIVNSFSPRRITIGTVAPGSRARSTFE